MKIPPTMSTLTSMFAKEKLKSRNYFEPDFCSPTIPTRMQKYYPIDVYPGKITQLMSTLEKLPN